MADNIFDKIGDLIHNLGEWIGDLFNAAQKAWNRVEPEVQTALIHGSGVIDTINRNLDLIPDSVLNLILQRFPDLTREKLEEGLKKVAEALKIAGQTEDADLLTTIKNLQAYLSSLQGNFWQAVSSILAQVLAIAFAPPGTQFAKIALLIEFVYNNYIKRHQ